MVRYLLVFVVGFLLIAIGGFLFVSHHYMDYDIPSLLLEAHIITPQNTKDIPSLSQIHHVFVIVEENHDWKDIFNNEKAPYINKTLLKNGGYASQYYNLRKYLSPLHPSEPNYIMLLAGKIAFPDHTFKTDDSPSAANTTSSHDHLAYLFDKTNLSWKSYQEDISGIDCPIKAIKNYEPKHNPFIYFHDVSGNPPSAGNQYCIHHIRPATELQTDITKHILPQYAFISPNMQHDMHTGTIAEADAWLASFVPMIVNSEEFKKDGVLFILWDEGKDNEDENKPIGMIVVSPFAKKGYTNVVSYSHASFVKTVQEIFHLSPLLGMAGDSNTNDLSDFFRQ